MKNEAFKKQMLSSHELFQAKRWEGKPFSFKFKYLLANHPEILIGGIICFFIAPACAYMKYITYPNSYRESMLKFRAQYTVVREDDPNIESIKKQKEFGKEFFPQF